MARWAEYFGQLFTVDPPTEQLHTTGLQAVDADPPIDESAPSLDEVREAVAKLRGGKAAGVCNISAELLKAVGEAMIHGLHAVLTAVWQSGTIPPDWKRGLVVPIWKGKGDRQDCNNYRGITLLSVPGKVLAHLLLTRIRSHLVKHQRPQQSGFTPGKSTTDRILALRVLVERRREFRQGMLAAYVDLKKAFDSVHRESLWDLLRFRGIPAGTIGLITGLYSGTESAVKCGAGVSGFFPVNTGVRQGCVLAPSPFNACMDWVLDKVVDQSDCGASVGNTKITDLVFADDAVIFAESLEVLVMALEALHEEAKPLGLEVSWLKTKVQVFGDLLDEAVQSVHACGEDIEILESFTYLGSAVHNDGGSRQEVLRRIGIAHGVMDSLSGSNWRCRYLCRRTKIRIFKSLVIPVLLYGCETWTLNSDLKRRINAFGNKCLRRIMGYRWDDYNCVPVCKLDSSMNGPGGASSKGGIPLLYPTTPYTLPGVCVYPAPAMVYPHVMPPQPLPPACLPPHAAMKGHNLYFSGPMGVPSVPSHPPLGSVTAAWPYHGSPIVEGALNHRPYSMPSMAPAYQGLPYYYYMMPVPHPHMPLRPSKPGTKVLAIREIGPSEPKGTHSDGKMFKSVVKSQCGEIIQSATKESKFSIDKGEELEDSNTATRETTCKKEGITTSHEEETQSSASLSNATPDKSTRVTNKSITKEHKTSTKKRGKQRNGSMDDVVIEDDETNTVVGVDLCDVNDKEHPAGDWTTPDRRDEQLRPRGGTSCRVQGVITEVHCRMGKLRVHSGTEHYFSPDLCYLYGVSLAHLELWHVLIEGQPVKVTLDNMNSERPKVTRVTVEEGDPDLDPDATVLQLQQWCAANCVPEEAAASLIQQVRGMQ
ncbi:LINE-1 reverse transcriptase [Chionoecetes opilio]|uniref:LINE-1 reverse transcriptase n=1 Tax=Chionoecetes opilio TaxID=41210 RepID=A0A8J4YNS9_CHIOP|nr:LINE-1 reverse transcriptase [Chionoecetes opilio]